MTEYIDRQAAIDAINHELLCGSTADACGLETAYDLIHELKPADVRPVVHGEWIVKTDADGKTYGVCNKCGYKQYAGHLKFCPDCGADMRGEDDGN